GHLQRKLGVWLGGADAFPIIRRVYECLSELLEEFSLPPRPLAEGSEAILRLPSTVFADRELGPEDLHDRAEIEAFEAPQSTLAEHADVPESLTPVVSGALAIRLTLEHLENESVPPLPDETALELLGWLELPLDDAPVLVVTSF